MKILTFTSLYPNCEMPQRGVFVENRLRHLVHGTDVEARVICPVPWFPFSVAVSEEYRRLAKVPHETVQNGIKVVYPRYFHLPKVGMLLQPFTMTLAAMMAVKKLRNKGYDFELIDAHYFYPDGIAAAILGRLFQKPVVITARGTDINLIPQYHLPRKLIQWAAGRAHKLITVCQALKDALVELNVPEAKVRVLRNGVDLDVFVPADNRENLRQRLGLVNKTVLSVGYLIERKGHHLIIGALEKLPDVELLIAGNGEMLEELKALARSRGVSERVKFLGLVPHSDLKDYYGAVDAMVLASNREGWANVLLESMACGTPVVATNIWGTPEVVAVPEAGVLVERSENSIADGIKHLLNDYPDRNATRKYAEQFSWDETTSGQYELFSNIAKQRT